MSERNEHISDLEKARIDLKLKELESQEKIDFARLEWEKEKWRTDKDSEKQFYNIMSTVIQGPIADLTRTLGLEAKSQEERFQNFKLYYETFIKPILDEAHAQNTKKMLWEIKSLESLKPSPIDYIKRLDEVRKELNLSQDAQTLLDAVKMGVEVAKAESRGSTYKSDYSYKTDTVVDLKCPNCLRVFPIIFSQWRVVCPYCKTILQRDC